MFKILVADDEPWMRKGIISKIQQWGCPDIRVAAEARNGAEALQLFDTVRPDIVITDIRMPEIDGLQLVENIQGKYPCVEFIIISGYAEFDYAQQAISMGVSNYLLKPIKASELEASLQKAISSLKKTREIDGARMERLLNMLVLQGKEAITGEEEWSNLKNHWDELYYAVIFIHCDYVEPSIGNFREKKKIIRNEIRMALDKETEFYLCEYLKDSHEYFVVIYAIDPQKLEDRIKEAGYCIFQRLESVSKSPVSIGISCIAKGLPIFRETFEQAKKAADNRFLNSDSEILLQRILKYINEHLCEPINREDISKRFNITPNYFSRLFCEKFNITFSQFIITKRLEKAKELLTTTEMSVSDIARVSGYDDVQYFWKVFRRVVGTTPQQYRQEKGKC